VAFRVDALGITFATLASTLWLAASMYSSGYVRAENMTHRPRYFACFAASIGAALGVAFAANLLTFLLFYELLTLMTYPLVVHRQTPEAIAAGRRYLAFALSAGMILLVAIAWTWQATGTMDFRAGGILAGHVTGARAAVLFCLFLTGCGVKAAIMPLHSWLPAAMIAPTPVSALLHAVAVVKAGVFGMVRIVCHVFGVDLVGVLGLGVWLGAVASATMVLGSFFAIGEDNLKRRLAYSTISQLSYILFGVALLSPFGVKGAMVHIPFHGFMKITLFLCAGTIMVVSGKKQISQLAGIGRQMPITLTAFAIGALGMCGAPPVAGFISKWFLCLGAIEAGLMIFLAVILVSSLLDVIYFFPIVKTAFFDTPRASAADVGGRIRNLEWGRPLVLFMVVPLALTALFSIVFCFFPSTFYLLNLVERAANSLF
jgi:formate hydrogenlyase subunit 3/multisubunit Na+/H+ antiporter MnhD subunit